MREMISGVIILIIRLRKINRWCWIEVIVVLGLGNGEERVGELLSFLTFHSQITY